MPDKLYVNEILPWFEYHDLMVKRNFWILVVFWGLDYLQIGVSVLNSFCASMHISGILMIILETLLLINLSLFHYCHYIMNFVLCHYFSSTVKSVYILLNLKLKFQTHFVFWFKIQYRYIFMYWFVYCFTYNRFSLSVNCSHTTTTTTKSSTV